MPEVGGNRPVRIDLWIKKKEGTGVRGCTWTCWALNLAYSHSGGLSCSVVSQEGGNLSLVETQCKAVHRQLFPVPVDLDQVLNVDPGLKMGWLFLHAHR